MFDLLLLALLAGSFAALVGFVHGCAALTHRDSTGQDKRP